MNKEQFWDFFNTSTSLYVVCYVVVFLMSFLLSPKENRKILHPYFFYYIFNYSFAGAATLFLFFKQEINTHLLFLFFLSQLSFIFGVNLTYYKFKPSHKESSIETTQIYTFWSDKNLYYIYIISVMIFLTSSIITFSIFGAGVFQESRWETYKSIPGAGVIGRFSEVSKILIIFYLSSKYIILKRITKKEIVLILFIVLASILSGSKMAVLEIMLIAFISISFVNRQPIKKSIYLEKIRLNFKVITALSITIMGGLLTTYLHAQTVGINMNDNSLSQLFFGRLIMSGDLQIMSYPNSVLSYLSYEKTESFLEIFLFDLKGFLSIFNITFSEISLGNKVMYYHYPYLQGIANIGPASTFETFYYYHFEFFGAVILSLLTGIGVGIANKITKQRTKLSILAFKVGIAYLSITLIYNPQVAIGKLIFFTAIFILIVTTLKIVRKSSFKTKSVT